MALTTNLDLGLSQYPPTADPELRMQLQMVYNAIHNIHDYIANGSAGGSGSGGSLPTSGELTADELILRATIGSGTKIRMIAGENLTYGQVVTIRPGQTYNPDTGSWRYGARAVCATNRIYHEYTPDRWTWPIAMGMCTSVDGIARDASGEITLGPALVVALVDLAPGRSYFLSRTTPGAIEAHNPVTTDTTPSPQRYYPMRQFVGVALASNALYFNPWGTPSQVDPTYVLPAP